MLDRYRRADLKTIRSLPSTSPVIGRDGGNGVTLSAEQHPGQPLDFGALVVEQIAHGNPYRYEVQVQVEDQGQAVLRLPVPPPFVKLLVVDANGAPLYQSSP